MCMTRSWWMATALDFYFVWVIWKPVVHRFWSPNSTIILLRLMKIRIMVSHLVYSILPNCPIRNFNSFSITDFTILYEILFRQYGQLVTHRHPLRSLSYIRGLASPIGRQSVTSEPKLPRRGRCSGSTCIFSAACMQPPAMTQAQCPNIPSPRAVLYFSKFLSALVIIIL